MTVIEIAIIRQVSTLEYALNPFVDYIVFRDQTFCSWFYHSAFIAYPLNQVTVLSYVYLEQSWPVSRRVHLLVY